MSTAELEGRLLALEAAVEQLRASFTPSIRALSGAADLTDGVECPVVLTPPPHKLRRLYGRIRGVRRGHQGLGLSDSEWNGLHLEESR